MQDKTIWTTKVQESQSTKLGISLIWDIALSINSINNGWRILHFTKGLIAKI
jgi:hypothetical protein